MGLFYSKSEAEPSPCNLLTVKIIQMKNARKADLLTQSDCYVSLSLPTASVQHFRTKTVQNSKNPTWNETFHFTIQSQVKNILELKVCDEDSVTQDDHLLTVFFDVSKIQLGENIQLSFQLNPQGKEELEVEFTMESSPDPPENIVTNGVLVSREVSCLDVQVNGGRIRKDTMERKFALTVDGSYEGTQTHTLSSCLCPTSPARFHYIKYHQSALTVALPRRRHLSRSTSSQNERDMNESVTLPLNSLPIQEKITIAEDRTIDLYTKASEWTQGLCFRPRNLDARLGFDLCTDEQNFLQNRKKVVAAALKDVLHLEEDLQEHEVPIVAVTTAGCGIRALTGMYGSILGLQKLRVLDCVSYISGSSGTTWTMTKLYEDADWSRKDLGEVIIEARKQAAKCKMGAFCLKSLRNYYRELSQRTQAGHKTSFIDLWGLMIESMLNDGKSHHRLSDQRQAVNQGQNPLPIYLALNVKDKVSTKDFREWVEFTPYEVGFLKYGAFIRAEDFGSEFFMGRLMKKLPESRICFMQGMWSSIFSKNLLDAWHAADNSEDFWHRWTQDKVTEIEEQPDLPEKPYEMATCVFTPTSGLSTTLRDILTDRPAVSKYHNFLRGLQMHNEYIQHEHFTKWKDTLLDTSPNDLRGNSEHLELVDAAFFFETSYPPLMRPERKVDVIIHLNYTGGSQTLPLEQACAYFAEQGIPFPCIGLKDDEKNLKECYMFDGADTPGAPLLLYFPLVNDTFQRYVTPGMARTAAEMEQGKVDISSFSSPYSTREVSLKAEDFNKLLKLTNYNIMNNENMILQALRMAVARKKQALSQTVSQEQPSTSDECPCSSFFVKIVRMKNLRKTDLLSQTDCYISLTLPTASPETVRTKTIKNCKDPVWNETFCFRIQSQVKNILEMKVYDENAVTKDDLLFTVLFDIAKIQLGETVRLTFQLNPKTQETLEVEFVSESIPVLPEKLVTNGVLVSREISCLEVLVDNRWTKKEPSEKDFLFSVKGSYEESQTLSLGSFWQPVKPLNFHYIKYSLSELRMALAEKKPHFYSVSGEEKKDYHASLTIPLDSLPFNEKVAVAKDETINLHVKSNDWNSGLCLRSRNLDVRLEFDLCKEEKNFLQKRKKFVASALKKALHLEQDLQDHEIPVVAVMTTGGGTRALTSLLGNLLGLQKLGLLDAISYITGSSGSTWTLSHLYQNPEWSHKDLSRPIGEVRRHMTKCKLSCFSLESLKYYAKELKLRKQEGYQISSVDFWGLLLEKALSDGKNNHKLSDEQQALNQGQNPLPIYMILNIKEDYSLSEFKEWVEFTPYEVGFLKYGAFIRAEDFGSEFFMGRLMKKLPESRICFMKGLWSNVFSYNLLDAWHSSNPTERRSLRCTQHRAVDVEDEPSSPDGSHELETYLVTPECGIMGIIRRLLTERVIFSKFYNFLKGFQLHNAYLQSKNFCMWKDTVLEHFPSQLTQTAEFMCLADTAGYIDISYPPLMRPERKVDVVLHLNYSSGSQTLPLEEASKYFQKQGIPFPKIHMSEEEKKNLKECYIFEDTETPEAPTVVFFPLVNDSFRKYKEPGVERSPAEMEQGNVDVSTIFSPYCLNSFTYKGEDFDKLIELTSYNIQNNQHLILQALNSAIEQKRQRKK
ncbi:LOW QUALITY PROTEIN: uncharacterized protein LOC126651122 [Myiozetetes cayanensis]|uniref:LOW QUALITY PROTEIN: uncharacterized protein LOC126651122 n=1 Tax=Myiozetetes cayanensis TaxID=478635 RepID=UPI0021603CF3|nr:LOW QUALITY PROTEIN: uncharacterized protein LOC126651122 [Myiozetetes cayanensis]